MNTTTADYYYIRIRMTESDETYHDVIVQYSDMPWSYYEPYPHGYESYVISLFETYCKAKQYYYYSLWAVYGNYHGIIAEMFNDWYSPFYFDAHTEVKEFLAKAKDGRKLQCQL